MLEKALTGSRNYWLWIGFLLVIIGVGVACWFWQFREGLTITGLSRDSTSHSSRFLSESPPRR
jgi:molybdopterin-containing oxidoreductase family membrane subunit